MPNEVSLPCTYRVYDHLGAFIGHANRFFVDPKEDFQIGVVVDKNGSEDQASCPSRSSVRESVTIPYSFLQADDAQLLMVLRAPFAADDVAFCEGYQSEELDPSPLVEQYLVEDYTSSKERSGVISLL